MNIGDRVRVIHGNEEGFITKIIDDRLVEIEIEPGFNMPVLMNEIVVIDKAEKDHFGDNNEQEVSKKPTTSSLAQTGIFLAIIKSDSTLADLYLINNTEYDLICSLTTIRKDNYEGIYKGIINSSNYELIGKWNINDFESWPELHFQTIYFANKAPELLSPFVKKIKFNAKTFYSNKGVAPLIDKEAHVYSFDTESYRPEKIVLKEQSGLEINTIEPPDDIIDLHIDKITDYYSNLSSSEIFQIQFKHFIKKLEDAVAVNKPEIIFIHGVGNGSLKNALHRELSIRKDITYFKDAMKNKFGYGATLVRIIN